MTAKNIKKNPDEINKDISKNVQRILSLKKLSEKYPRKDINAMLKINLE